MESAKETSMSLEEEIHNILSNGMMAPRTMVLGVGGAGCNVADYIYHNKSENMTVVAVNTDEKSIMNVNADKKILIGKNITHGKDAGGYPEIAEKCIEDARDEVFEVFTDVDIVFVVAGLGGGTGTGATPTVVEMAKAAGSVVVSMLIRPFEEECRPNYNDTLDYVKLLSDSTIVLENSRLSSMVSSIGMAAAFGTMNKLILNTIDSATNIIDKSLLSTIAVEVSEAVGNTASFSMETTVPEHEIYTDVATEFVTAGDTISPGTSMPDMYAAADPRVPENGMFTRPEVDAPPEELYL